MDIEKYTTHSKCNEDRSDMFIDKYLKNMEMALYSACCFYFQFGLEYLALSLFLCNAPKLDDFRIY